MKYSYLRNPKARIAWSCLTLGPLLWIGAGITLSLMGWHHPDVTARDSADLVRMIGGMPLLLVVFGVPFLTTHEMRGDSLIVRQGLNFRGVIPYENVASVQTTERKPIGGLGLRPYPHTLFVITWPDNLVSIRLKRPQRFRLFQIVPLWKMEEMIVNVDNPGSFVMGLRSRVII